MKYKGRVKSGKASNKVNAASEVMGEREGSDASEADIDAKIKQESEALLSARR